MGPEDGAGQGIVIFTFFFLLGRASVKMSCLPVEGLLLVFPPGSPVPNVSFELYSWFDFSFSWQLDLTVRDSLTLSGFWFFSVIHLLYVGLLLYLLQFIACLTLVLCVFSSSTSVTSCHLRALPSLYCSRKPPSHQGASQTFPLSVANCRTDGPTCRAWITAVEHGCCLQESLKNQTIFRVSWRTEGATYGTTRSLRRRIQEA